MKKLLTLSILLAMTTGASFAASYFDSVKNAAKQDIQTVKAQAKADRAAAKEAFKKDIENKINASTEAQTKEAKAKKAEKIKQIDKKLTELNKQLTTIKNDKNITETERTIKTRSVQRQIEFYNKHKAALK